MFNGDGWPIPSIDAGAAVRSPTIDHHVASDGVAKGPPTGLYRLLCQKPFVPLLDAHPLSAHPGWPDLASVFVR